MLRIIQTESAGERRWILCGQLAGRWVHELDSQWREFVASPLGRSRTRSVIDLTDVTFIDEEGEMLLGQMKEQGAELVAGSGVATRDLLDNLQTNGCRPVRRMLGRADETY